MLDNYTRPSARPTLGRQPAGDARARWARLMHQVNVNMRRLQQLDPIAVFCECGTIGCRSVLWVSAAEFDAGAGRAGRVVLAGHRAGRRGRRRLEVLRAASIGSAALRCSDGTG